MTTQFLLRTGIVALATGMAGIASGQTDEIVRTIPLAPGGQFSLGNISGDIAVTGTDSADLTLRVTKRLVDPAAASGAAARDALDRIEIEIRERGDQVSVETEYRAASA